MKQRGVFEKERGSGVWWIRYTDVDRKLRREKAGTKSTAIALVEKRRTEVRQRLKLPENFRARPTSFAELAQDTLAYSRACKRSYSDDRYRMAKIVEEFGDRVAEGITPQEIDSWLGSHEQWMVATRNRYLALIKLTYRLAEENRKVKTNPGRMLHMRKENNARVRYINQFEPPPAQLHYLKSYTTEEGRLRAVIQANSPFHLPELDIALNTGLRRGEQYSLLWANVNFTRRMLTVPRSKHGDARHIPLNSVALAAFQALLPNVKTSDSVFLNMDGDHALQGNRHWFEEAVAEAGLRDFTWHSLRHTFASRLVMAGVDLRTVQELMGHKTIQMTCRYTHLAPAHQLAAVEKLLPYAAPRAETPSGTARVRRKSERRHGNQDVSNKKGRRLLSLNPVIPGMSILRRGGDSNESNLVLDEPTSTRTDTRV